MKQRKKILILVIIFLSSLFIASDAWAKSTILDYYNSIPVNLLDGKKFPLQLKNNKWITKSSAGYDFEPVVDIKNGYINITDEGTGGGSLIHELALYRTDAGSDFIGVILTSIDGISPVSKLKFYKPSENKWTDITNDIFKDVLPKLNLSLFLDENLKISKEEIRRVPGIAFVYYLPRIGTTMRIMINVDGYMINQNKSAKSKEIVENIKYKEIKLIWDKNKIRFMLGEKIPFTLSERIKNL